MCKIKMFETWLRMDSSATYERLARTLVTVGKRNIAEAMCTARGMEFTVLECLWRVCVYYIVHTACAVGLG